MAPNSGEIIVKERRESLDRVENNDPDETLPPCRECERHFFARNSTFNVFDGFIVVVSMITFVADILTDGVVTCQYFAHGEIAWGLLTLGFVVVAAFIMQVFSIRWYLADEDMAKWRWIIHGCLLGPLERYMAVFMTGLEARRSKDPLDFERLHHQQSDVCMLRLFESFLESAPQVVLQLYIMVATNDENIFTGISGVVSLISLCWAVVAYSRAHRRVRIDKKSVSWPGVILQTVWRIGMVSSRVVALVLFASAFGAYTFIFVGVHWLAMVLWVYFQRTDFCATWLEERLFNCVVGTMYVFCFFNLKEGNTRYRVAVFYSVVAVENVVLLLLWHRFGRLEPWYTWLGFLIVFGGFVIGTVSMVLYYRFFHPKGAIEFCNKKPSRSRTVDVCLHGKSNHISTLSRHGNTEAEIFHRHRSSPQRGLPKVDGSRSPQSDARFLRVGEVPDLVSVEEAQKPPRRSRSLGSLSVTSEGGFLGDAWLKGHAKSLDSSAELNRPHRLRNHDTPEPSGCCTCSSFQPYEWSGFATELVDRFDRRKMAALAAQSSMSPYLAHRNGVACEACWDQRESGLSVPLGVSELSSLQKLQDLEHQGDPFQESGILEVSRVTADLQEMPDCIDSPDTDGAMSAYDVQKIYDQILGRKQPTRTSKRQLQFEQSAQRDVQPQPPATTAEDASATRMKTKPKLNTLLRNVTIFPHSDVNTTDSSLANKESDRNHSDSTSQATRTNPLRNSPKCLIRNANVGVTVKVTPLSPAAAAKTVTTSNPADFTTFISPVSQNHPDTESNKSEVPQTDPSVTTQVTIPAPTAAQSEPDALTKLEPPTHQGSTPNVPPKTPTELRKANILSPLTTPNGVSQITTDPTHAVPRGTPSPMGKENKPCSARLNTRVNPSSPYSSLASDGNKTHITDLLTPNKPTSLGMPNRPTPLGVHNTPTHLGTPSRASPLAKPNRAIPLAKPNRPTPLSVHNTPTHLGTPNRPTPLATPNRATPPAKPKRSTHLATPNRATPLATPNRATPMATPNRATPLATPNRSTHLVTPINVTSNPRSDSIARLTVQLLSPSTQFPEIQKKSPRKSLGKIPTNLVADKVAIFTEC